MGKRFTKTGRLLYLLVLLTFTHYRGIQAQTIVSGIISADSTFGIAGSPWIIPDSVVMDSGFTLLIEPGVEVQFDSGAQLIIYGTIRASGSSLLPVVFTSHDTADTAGTWKFVVVDSCATDYNSGNGTGSIFRNCIFEYAGHGNVQNEGALRLKSSFPRIDSCEFRYNASCGLNASWRYGGGTLDLHYCHFHDNDARFHGGGAMLQTAAGNNAFITLNVSNNQFRDNSAQMGTGGGLSVYLSSGQVNASWNTFENNYAYGQGGGLYVYTPPASISPSVVNDNRFIRNSSATNGGGLSVSMAGDIRQNLFFGNTAADGAGIQNENGSLTRNIFANNNASGLGGAILNEGKDTLRGNNITDNRALDQAGIRSLGDPAGFFRYNTLTRNTSGATPSNRTIYHMGGLMNGSAASTIFQNCNLSQNKGPTTHYEFSNDHLVSNADLINRYCWWSTTVSGNVSGLIEDYYDNASIARIVFAPLLNSPDTIAPLLPPTNVRKADLGGGSIKVTWDANLESDLAGYRIYYGNATGYSFSNCINAGNTTNFQINGGVVGINDSIAVTAYDLQQDSILDQFEGHESWFSYADMIATAGFSISTDTICAGDTLFFTDQSTGAQTWSWSFPGGNPGSSSLSNPAVVYSTPGTYSVRQTISNNLGSDSVVVPNAVTVLASPHAMFSFSTNNQTISFSNSSTGAGSILWDFGDGNTSSMVNPVHTYTNSGTYNVCLHISNLCGTDSVCHSVTASCSGPPIPAFSFSTTPNGVQFSDLSAGPGSWHWDFGDGGSSTLQNPLHNYAFADTFLVCLIATNSCGSDTACHDVIVACTQAPQTQWTYSANAGTVTFSDQSLAAGAWFWNFGDGATSTQQNPQHLFTANGTYNVCLVTSNACGDDTLCQQITITGVGISQLNNSLRVYPNPANEVLHFECGQEGILTLSSATGQVLIRQPLNPGLNAVNLRGLSNGVYIWRFENLSGKVQVRN